MTGKIVLKTRVTPLSALAGLRRNKTLLRKTFTAAELRYALAKRFPDQSLGARLAAKRAFLSALGPKKSRLFALISFEILNDAYGKPHLRWKKESAAVARKAGIRQVSVSLSHADHYAVASVMVSLT